MSLDTLQKIGQLAGVALGLAVIAATILAYFRVSLTQAQVKKLREDLMDADAREERRDGEIRELKAINERQAVEKVALETKINDLEHLVENLQRLIQGTEQLTVLQKDLLNHDKRVDKYHDALGRQIEVILENQRNVLQRLDSK